MKLGFINQIAIVNAKKFTTNTICKLFYQLENPKNPLQFLSS